MLHMWAGNHAVVDVWLGLASLPWGIWDGPSLSDNNTVHRGRRRTLSQTRLHNEAGTAAPCPASLTDSGRAS